MAASVELLAALATLTWLKPQAVAVNSFTAHPSGRVVTTDSARSYCCSIKVGWLNSFQGAHDGGSVRAFLYVETGLK